jgi:hypothetical protein
MPISTINVLAGTTTQAAQLNKTGGDANIAFQTGGQNALSISNTQLAVFNSTGAVTVPKGTTAQRPTVPVNGMIRYNTTTARFEGYVNGWVAFT